MASIGKIPIKIKKLDKTIYVDAYVMITREFRIRVMIGMTLIRLAAIVLGCSIKINSIGGKNEDTRTIQDGCR